MNRTQYYLLCLSTHQIAIFDSDPKRIIAFLWGRKLNDYVLIKIYNYQRVLINLGDGNLSALEQRMIDTLA